MGLNYVYLAVDYLLQCDEYNIEDAYGMAGEKITQMADDMTTEEFDLACQLVDRIYRSWKRRSA